MLATSIKSNNQKVEAHILEQLCNAIVSRLATEGFITESDVVNGSSIKIGQHMRSFSINTNMLGSNARYGDYTRSVKGYKRTNVPTWSQRVEFNNIVNRIFDQFGLSANIKSGPFTIRKGLVSMNEDNWLDQLPHNMGSEGQSYNGLGQVMSHIIPESEARDMFDSDRLEAEHKANSRPERLAQAKARRALMKAFEASPKVCIDGMYSKENNKNGSLVTHKAFDKLVSKLSHWESKRVKEASIKATVNFTNNVVDLADVRKKA